MLAIVLGIGKLESLENNYNSGFFVEDVYSFDYDLAMILFYLLLEYQ